MAVNLWRLWIVCLLLGGLAACGGGEQERLSAEARARCGSRGAPASVDKIVEVLRANGITADLDELECEDPGSSGVAHVTNMGFDGLQPREDVRAVEGDVICTVYPKSYGRAVEITKYAEDAETIVGVLNVQCRVYPSDEASRKRQVQRLSRALEALVRAAPR